VADWTKAPLPPRRHICSTYSVSEAEYGQMHRCACGGARYVATIGGTITHIGRWELKNARRRDPVNARRYSRSRLTRILKRVGLR